MDNNDLSFAHTHRRRWWEHRRYREIEWKNVNRSGGTERETCSKDLRYRTRERRKQWPRGVQRRWQTQNGSQSTRTQPKEWQLPQWCSQTDVSSSIAEHQQLCLDHSQYSITITNSRLLASPKENLTNANAVQTAGPRRTLRNTTYSYTSLRSQHPPLNVWNVLSTADRYALDSLGGAHFWWNTDSLQFRNPKPLCISYE